MTSTVGFPNAHDHRPNRVKPSIGLEPMTPSLPWKCSTN